MAECLPEFAVVIPTRNRWRLLRTALASVLAQEGVSLRVVVVDDGSTEPDPGVLREPDPRVEVVRLAAPRGVSAARNVGLERVEAAWVAFLDDDDVWAPEHLATVASRLAGAHAEAGAPPVGLVYAAHVVLDAGRRVTGVRPVVDADAVPDALLASNVIGTPSCVVLRSEAVRAAGGFDSRFAIVADWDLYLRVLERARPVASDAFTVGYTLHGENMHLAAGATARETEELRRRYRARAAARGRHRPDPNYLRYIAGAHRISGERLRASAWYLRTFALSRRPGDLARAGGVLLGERVTTGLGLAPRPPALPEEPAWLAPVRRLEAAPL